MNTQAPEISDGKAAWRRWLRQRKEPEPTTIHARLVKQVRQCLKNYQVSSIAAFQALPDEPDLSSLFENESCYRWVFPRITPAGLSFHEISEHYPARLGQYGISEPADTAPLVSPSEIDLLLCPGLAFGRDLTRLGRGKGYYDRYLPRLRPGTPIIGVAYPWRIFSTVPHSSHDYPMSKIINL